jgi:hypothetical protein
MKINNNEAVMQPKQSLRARGIGYDTGFCIDGIFNRSFDQTLVRSELQIIHDDLHCNAVRLIGNDLDRLEFAANHAADLGLEIWFSPFPMGLDPKEVLQMLADGAERIDAAFVCTFVCYGWPHRSNPREDLDMASWGVVKVLENRLGDTYPDMPWEPKDAFSALADYYHG